MPLITAGLMRCLALGAGTMVIAPASAFDGPCTGHEPLPAPRPELSCIDAKPELYPSPDGALVAVVVPADISLDATPDSESRVAFRTNAGATLTSVSHASPRGEDGFYVVSAQWSPDATFFVYSLSSSGGHSPWSFPTMVYSRERNAVFALSDMIQHRPIVASDFKFTGPHTLTASTWKQPGSPDKPMPVTIDLQSGTKGMKEAAP